MPPMPRTGQCPDRILCQCGDATHEMIRWSWLHYNNRDRFFDGRWVPGTLMRRPRPYLLTSESNQPYLKWVKDEVAKHWEKMMALSLSIANYATALCTSDRFDLFGCLVTAHQGGRRRQAEGPSAETASVEVALFSYCYWLLAIGYWRLVLRREL